MDLLLDTQAFIDSYLGAKLPRRVQSLLADPENTRMIIATAMAEGIPVVGSDRKFRKYRGPKVIW